MLGVLGVVFSSSLAVQAQAPPAPTTRPERTAWQETSTNADVDTFLQDLAKLPYGARIRVQPFGATAQGRPLVVAYARDSEAKGDAPKLRALIIANIHAGEVEGKEAAQILLREIASGEHTDILRWVDLAIVPVFNADGNDEIDRGNRVEQNGPDGGVGRRHNSQDRDLNRDFIKAESPEARALLAVFAKFAPHLFMDLHTTNGSYHGYHLTYCTSLNANCDPDIATLMHDRFIPSVRARMQKEHGLRIFDYGNFGRGGPESGWTTFSADPRLAINYAGLRHCLSLLSEAYSYLSYEDRAKATRAFVLESLHELVARREEISKIRAQAEARATTLPFRFGHELAPPVQGELLVGAVEEKTIEGLGKRLLVKPEFHAVQVPLQTRFVAKHEQPLPKGWAVVGDFAFVAQIVRAHGIDAFTLDEAMRVPAEALAVAELSRQRAAFQGHRLVKLAGTFAKAERELPAGTLIVPAGHKLARLAAQLLEGTSDDGLATWGYFGDSVTRADQAEPGKLSYPVLRLDALPPAAKMHAVAFDEPSFPRLVPYLPMHWWYTAADAGKPLGPDSARDRTADLDIEVEAAGRRIAARGFEAEAQFEGRKLRFTLGAIELDTLAAVEAALAARKAKGTDLASLPAAVWRGPGVTHRELVEACEALHRDGVDRVFLSLDRKR